MIEVRAAYVMFARLSGTSRYSWLSRVDCGVLLLLFERAEVVLRVRVDLLFINID